VKVDNEMCVSKEYLVTENIYSSDRQCQWANIA